jgi:hypothetical protein
VVLTRELRALCNELYDALDLDFLPHGARGNYAGLRSQLKERELRAQRQPRSAAPPRQPKNPVSR